MHLDVYHVYDNNRRVRLGIPEARIPWEVKRAGGKIRVLRPFANGTSYEFAWNGNRFTALKSDPKAREDDRYGGMILAEPASGATKALYFGTAIEQDVFDFDEPLSELLGKGKWRVVGEEQVGDSRCIRLSGDGFNPATKFVVSAWVDPFRDFAPLKFVVEIHLHGKTIVSTMDDVKLDDSAGLWTISSATMRVFNPIVNESRTHLSEVTITNPVVGAEFPDDTFEIRFPVGASIWDDVAKVGRVVGKGRMAMGPDGLARFIPEGASAAEVQALLTKPPDPPPAAATGSRVRRALLATALLIGVAAVVIVVTRWLKSKPATEVSSAA